MPGQLFMKSKPKGRVLYSLPWRKSVMHVSATFVSPFPERGLFYGYLYT